MLFRLAMSLLVCVVSTTIAVGDESSAQKKPVLVFVLSGQSNMTGRGIVGNLGKPSEDQKATLVRYIKSPENIEKYKALYSGPQKDRAGWTIRDDVFILYGERSGGLAPNYGGFRDQGIGPELGIGFVLGEHFEHKILLIKIAFGANNLAKNFRPPSSGGEVGERYNELVSAVKKATDRLPELVPGYDKSAGYELAGFFWNQGEHDTNPDFAAQYEANLANLITDLRKDLSAPNMKAVIAVTGCFGWDMESMTRWIKGEKTQEKIDKLIGPWNMVRDAQLAVAKKPEFAGNVRTVETRDFWRPQEKFGGNKQGIHWHANGESYWLVGESMGQAMVDMLDQKPE